MGADRAAGPWTRVRRRLGAIRVRTTIAAVLIVGLSLVIAAVAMVVFLERSLREHVRTTALIRAEAIADDLATGAGSDPVALGREDEEFVQVLDPGGDVLMASPNLAGRPPLVVLVSGQTRTLDRVPFEDGPFLAVAVSSTNELTVIVGRSLEGVTEARRAVTGLLGFGVPLLLAVAGAVTWLVVGRALAPVEGIRAEVEAISGKELHRRVPDPPGGDEIARLATTMNRMLGRLESGHLRERRFVSDASHELRSPIAVIRQHAEVALAHPDRTSIRELAEVVLEEDARLQRIVEDLLLLSRIDEGTLALRTAPLDLDDLMLEEAARLRGSTNVRIDVGGISAGRVLGDRRQLERLIRNLTDNAVRYSRGIVSLSLREGDGRVILAVEDDGGGIASVDRERVFDRFVRLEEARDRSSGGTGLGLAIVREIATAHGGTVLALDGRLGGALIEVRFPVLAD